MLRASEVAAGLGVEGRLAAQMEGLLVVGCAECRADVESEVRAAQGII